MSKLDHIMVVRRFVIDAGHRLHNHDGKCKNLHGHRYIFHVFITGPELDEVGRMIDFASIKSLVGNWLDDNWDHGMIIWEKDPKAFLWNREDGCGHLADQKHFFLPTNPTAENLSHYLKDVAQQIITRIHSELKVVRITCEETENCAAICSGHPPNYVSEA